MGRPIPLPIWDRRTGRRVEEWMEDHAPTCESEPRRSMMQLLESQPLYDRFVAAYQNTSWSARKIEPFIRKNHIDMDEFESVNYASFAEFFDRRFRPGVRSFSRFPNEMGAVSEGSYFAWERIETGQKFPVKGRSLDAGRILCETR